MERDPPESSASFPAATQATTIRMLAPRALGDAAALTRELGPWVLAGPPPGRGEDDEWSFRTMSAHRIVDAAGGIEAVLEESYLVLPLKKARPGPFASTVLVGRSRTNDICIHHFTISKLHARIRLASDGAYVSDAGSSNGTILNGTQLAPETEHKLAHGNLLRFGGCQFQVFEPARFVALLGQLVRSPDKR